MKFFCTFVFFLFLLPLGAFSQTNFKPGNIVNTKGDTLNGFIDYREWVNNPSKFSFKTLAGDQPRQVNVIDVKAVSVDGSIQYEVFKVSISKANVVAPLPANLDTGFKTDRVFLRLITKGKNASLYAFKDDVKNRFYALDNETLVITELGYYVYMDNKNHVQKTDNRYKGALYNLAAKFNVLNEAITRKIKVLDYNEAELLSVFRLINGDKGVQVERKSLTGTRFFLGAGVKASNVTFNGFTDFFTAGTQSTSTSPAITTGIDYMINKQTQRVFIRAELVASQGSFSFNETFADINNTSVSLKFKQYNIALVPQAIYNFYNTDELKAFVGAGAAINFAFYKNYSYSKATEQYGPSGGASPNLEKIWFSVPVKAGVTVAKHFEVFGACWLPGSIIINKNSGARMLSYQAGLNFFLTK